MPRDELRRLAKQLNKKQKPTIRPERATLVRIGDDGTAYVHFDGGVDETPAIMAMDANIGDTVTVWRSGGRCIINGNTTSPADVAKPMAIRAQRAAVNAQVRADNAQEIAATVQGNITAATGRIATLESDNVAVKGRLDAAEADIDDLEAEDARITNLVAGKASINDLNAATGRITVLESTKANIADIEANYITADDIEATYMHADMANADVAWIQNGVIKDGSISSAMINDVSANKLTAGTINGSVINVTNLNADNITTGTINGQRIGEGSLSLDKLSDDVYTESEVDAKLATMQAEIDGAIETWTGTEVPTLGNAPASNWSDSATRDTHVGDVYFVVNSQSQQNGYNYRFTKTGSTYSWQLIKDNDVTNALQRLETAEGRITQFDSDISTLKTDTGTLTTRTTSLETRADGVDSALMDKVDTTDFNELSDTVDGHTQTLSQHTTAISNKADGSTVTALTTRVSKNEQDISGINTTIGELQTTVASKADGSELTTVSNKLNTVSDTVDGHTQTISSVQSTLSTKADSSTVQTLRSEYNETKTTVSGHETRLTATESVANGVRTDLDNLKIGGRNLLRGSAALGETGSVHGWIPNGGVSVSLDTVDGIECIKVRSTAASAYIASGRTASRVNLEWGQTYIASCWLMFNEDINNAFGDSGPLHYQIGSVSSSDVFNLYINGHGGGVTTSEVEPDASYGNTIPANTWVRFVRKIVTADSAPNADYPYPVFAPFVYGWLRKATTSDEHITWIRGFKVEEGTIPTAWTPAPEDLETEVTTLKTDYATYKQTTTEALAEIGTTYATKTELGTETSNRQTAIQQVNDAISLKASSSDVYTKTQTDGLISTEVTNRNAAITAKADEITSSVSETYATKDSVSGIDTRLTTAESSITQQAGQIALKANAADVNTKAETTALLEVKANKATLTSEINASADTVKIDASRVNIEGAAIFTSGRLSESGLNTTIGNAVDAIEVGGRNLLRGTSTFTNYEGDIGSMSSSPVSGGYGGSASHIESKNAWSGVGIALHKVLQRVGAKIGDTITMSIWVSTDSETEVAHDIYLYRAKSGSSTPGINNPGGTNTSTTITLVKGQWQRVYVTFEVTDYALNTVKTTRFETSKASADYSLFWAAPKIEFGTKATDWTPAPEDTDAAISAAQATAAADATTKANEAQAAAISAAAADATSKANAAQAAAEATAAADATSKANAAQTAATDAANQATDQKLTSYSTTSQMNEAIGDAVDGLDFDSTNLLKNARKMALGAAADQSIGRWRMAGNSDMAKSRVEIEDGPYGPCGALQLSGTQEVTTDTSCFGMDAFAFPENNRVYEMSIYARVISGEGYAGILTRGYGKATVDVGNTTENWGTSVYRVRKLTSDWQRIWVRFRITAIANNLYIGGAGTDATIQICMARITEATATLPQAVKRTQRIYYRKSASGAPSAPSAWVTQAGDVFGQWTAKIPRMTANADGTGTKYPYLYTCEQREMGDGTLAYTTVLLDDSATVIDGGNIITGSVSANKLEAYDATIQKIRADAIDTSSITIGQSQVTGLTSTLNGKASTTDVANAAKRTYVSIRATAIDYAADTATLEATLYIDGVATTTGVTYAWLMDGTAISGATSRTYSVPASSGLSHAYSCKATW